MLKVKPTTEQRVAEKVRTGAFQSEDDVVREGLELIDAREAFRQAVAEGQAQLDRGEHVTREESRRRMAEIADHYRKRA